MRAFRHILLLVSMAVLLAAADSPEPENPAIARIRAIEAERLKSLVDGRLDVFDKYHARDYQLISPNGFVFTFETYRESLRSGKLDYFTFEAVSPLQIRLRDDSAIVRYQAKIHLAWEGRKRDALRVWHTDYYEHQNGEWRAVWSQATTIP